MNEAKKDNIAKINTFLREKRLEYRFTQQKVAEFLQINRTTYAKYENGRMPEPDVILLLCQLYKITPNEMFRGFIPRKPDGSFEPTDYLDQSEEPPVLTIREKEVLELFRECRRKERVEYIISYYIWEEERGLDQ